MPAKPSPFPGMDPWLERVWTPVHHEYISQVRRQLAAQLPDDLYAQVETDVYVVDQDVRGRQYRPDVSTSDQDRPATPTKVGGGTAAGVAEPVRVPVRRQAVPLRHVAIREPDAGHRLVTAVELFSPTNKGTAADRETYRRKREAYLTAWVNVVEIDLLRSGADLLDLSLDGPPPEVGTTYHAAVRFADPESGGDAAFYAMPLRDRLPRIAVPLRPTDPAAVRSVCGRPVRLAGQLRPAGGPGPPAGRRSLGGGANCRLQRLTASSSVGMGSVQRLAGMGRPPQQPLVALSAAPNRLWTSPSRRVTRRVPR